MITLAVTFMFFFMLLYYDCITLCRKICVTGNNLNVTSSRVKHVIRGHLCNKEKEVVF